MVDPARRHPVAGSAALRRPRWRLPAPGANPLALGMLWAPSMGPCLLKRDLKYGPLFCKRSMVVL